MEELATPDPGTRTKSEQSCDIVTITIIIIIIIIAPVVRASPRCPTFFVCTSHRSLLPVFRCPNGTTSRVPLCPKLLAYFAHPKLQLFFSTPVCCGRHHHHHHR
jgi:hypothetical protein